MNNNLIKLTLFPQVIEIRPIQQSVELRFADCKLILLDFQVIFRVNQFSQIFWIDGFGSRSEISRFESAWDKKDG